MRNKNEINIWESRYQQKQTGWDRGEESRAVSYWLNSGLVHKCSILVPGCGNGYEVVELARKGFDVTAIDIAPTPIKNLQASLDQAEVKAQLVEADFFNWEPKEPFDAIYEQTSLCALFPELWKQYEEKLYQWLKPEGILLAQFMQTGSEGGPPFHCDIGKMQNLFSSERWIWSEKFSSVGEKPSRCELMYMLYKK